MTTYRISYQMVRTASKLVAYTCPGCGKRRTKSFSREAAANGLHDMVTTRGKHQREVEAEAEAFLASPSKCKACVKAEEEVKSGRRLTIHDIREGDEIVTRTEVLKVTSVNLIGNTVRIQPPPFPEVTDERCPAFGQSRDRSPHIRGGKSKPKDIKSFVWWDETLWRDGVEIYPAGRNR